MWPLHSGALPSMERIVEFQKLVFLHAIYLTITQSSVILNQMMNFIYPSSEMQNILDLSIN